MELSGLHLLLTYQCTFECDHCFVWGSPWQSGTMTLNEVHHILHQARELGTVNSIYFEGGEPMMYYPILLKGVKEAHAMGFSVGIVSNSYWATNREDALEWLHPFAGLVEDLSISSDLFHYNEKVSQQTKNAAEAAEELGIPLGIISIAQLGDEAGDTSVGQLPIGESGIMYRGRAAEKLVSQAERFPWEGFNKCPYEDLRDPGRIHVDPLGYMHICQGISIGNILYEPLRTIWSRYNPDEHPITSALLDGGPTELVRRYDLPHQTSYADACHLCDQARHNLRQRFPEMLVPDQIYGIYG
jgi:MoaA/NifB/PqqE/SkfB family radical SAM enzyme